MVKGRQRERRASRSAKVFRKREGIFILPIRVEPRDIELVSRPCNIALRGRDLFFSEPEEKGGSV